MGHDKKKVLKDKDKALPACFYLQTGPAPVGSLGAEPQKKGSAYGRAVEPLLQVLSLLFPFSLKPELLFS